MSKIQKHCRAGPELSPTWRWSCPAITIMSLPFNYWNFLQENHRLSIEKTNAGCDDFISLTQTTRPSCTLHIETWHKCLDYKKTKVFVCPETKSHFLFTARSSEESNSSVHQVYKVISRRNRNKAQSWLIAEVFSTWSD